MQRPDRFRVETRRYQCQLCDAVVVVVPRGMLPRKRYSGPAIAFALALWSLGRCLTEPEVFDRVSILRLSPYVVGDKGHARKLTDTQKELPTVTVASVIRCRPKATRSRARLVVHVRPMSVHAQSESVFTMA